MAPALPILPTTHVQPETLMTSLPTYLADHPDTAGPYDDAGEHGSPEVNVGTQEPLLSAIGGGALAVYGLKRGGLSGALLLAAGGCLVYRGYSGHCTGYAALGINTADE